MTPSGTITNAACAAVVPGATLLAVADLMNAAAISSCIVPGLVDSSEFEIFLKVILKSC